MSDLQMEQQEQQRAKVQRTWLYFLPKLKSMSISARAQAVRCPLTALQNYLLGMGCEIPDPSLWKLFKQQRAHGKLDQFKASQSTSQWETFNNSERAAGQRVAGRRM